MASRRLSRSALNAIRASRGASRLSLHRARAICGLAHALNNSAVNSVLRPPFFDRIAENNAAPHSTVLYRSFHSSPPRFSFAAGASQVVESY
ncbi:hypothetical protein SLEP1_g15528 [Rubroshorea leprosula]|uniref:Uncharacterized protein n=1 Tax=Rubroshorea leprosula TaxID=152421 RepID=A0AAV5IWT8_9ROSI|nr:hypothetical protein SLEP1_g15528 [Rubroshorea leprosula]